MFNTNKDDNKTTIDKIMIQTKMIIKQHCFKYFIIFQLVVITKRKIYKLKI